MSCIPDQHQSQIASFLDKTRQLVRIGSIVVHVVTLPKIISQLCFPFDIDDVIPVRLKEHVTARPGGVNEHLLRAGVVADDVVGPVIVQHPVVYEYLL